MLRIKLKAIGIGCTLALFLTSAESAVEAMTKDKVLFLVDQEIYSQIETHVQTYKQAVEAHLPVTLLVDHERNYKQMSPEEIRHLLQEYYKEESIVGVILAGRLPYALWENHDENNGILSSFYEDLDGNFEDKGRYQGTDFLPGNPNGLYDHHDWGSPSADIFVAWLHPSPKHEVEELKFFLEKAGRYHSGDLTYRHRGLVMLHSDWAQDMSNYYHQLEPIFGKDVDQRGGLDSLNNPIPINGREYLQLLEQTYEATIFYAHGSPAYHFPDQSPVSVRDIGENPGGSILTFIGGCHTGDFKSEEEAYPDSEGVIATAYLFKNPIGLATTATAWSYGPEELWKVSEELGRGVWLGKAWLAKQRVRNSSQWYLIRYACSVDPQRHDWGELLFGDPFVILPCQLSCEGKSCGSDGCGGSCGSCPSSSFCQINDRCSQSLTWEMVELTSSNLLQNLFLEDYSQASLRLPSGWWVSPDSIPPSALCTLHDAPSELYYKR